MTDNNWITPGWIEKKRREFNGHLENQTEFIPMNRRVDHFLAAEINKEIKNILESAEKRDCKTCKYEHEDMDSPECLDCVGNIYHKWTPKEVK